MAETLFVRNNRGPLIVSAVNPRYFTDASGKAIWLAGFHTWNNIQDGDESDPPVEFDWDAYLQALVDYGCNHTRLWCHEMEQGWSDINGVYFKPTRYKRTGPGTGYDGKAKYDLTKINDEYLDRLYARAADCARRGIYVTVVLFDGWCTESKGLGGTPFLYHSYEATNNINSIDGDQNNDGEGDEVQYHGVSNVCLGYEEDLVEAILDKLNGLDNVIYEICNESTGSTENTDWHEHMMDHIRTYEAGLPKKHLVGFTKQYPNASSATIKASSADWGCYDSDYADSVYDGNGPVSIRDSDHVEGLTNTYNWIWKALCNGHGGVSYMDEWDGEAYGADTREVAEYILIRENLGYALAQAKLLKDMLGMTPQPELCSTGYCLAKDHATAAEYVCFQDGTGAFTLNLTNASGTLNIRWLKCADGTTSTDTVSGGAVRTLTPPWTGKVVAFVYH